MISIEMQKQIIDQLRNAQIESLDEYTPFPKPYFVAIDQVKAIYLGCDPSNNLGKRFCHAFALPDGTQYGFGRFVSGHEENLKQIGLGWNDLYVQNLCQNYFREETSNNLRDWNRAARIWIPFLKDELESIRSDVPVLLTSAYLYAALTSGKHSEPLAFYECREPIPISANDNLLNRPLIPFYRNRRKIDYHLANDRWAKYRESVKHIVTRKN